MTDLGAVEATEQIKKLKARYFRLLDAKQWDAWGDVFCEDAAMDVSDDVPEGTDPVVRGRENIVKAVSAMLDAAHTVHHGHMPEIEVTGPTTANGIWAMEDTVDFTPEADQPSGIHGTGWYHEQYRLDPDGRWRISSMKLVRLRVDPLV